MKKKSLCEFFIFFRGMKICHYFSKINKQAVLHHMERYDVISIGNTHADITVLFVFNLQTTARRESQAKLNEVIEP